MIELEKLEIFLRGGAFATLLLCAGLFAARARITRKDLSVASLCIGLCAYVLVSSPGIGPSVGTVLVPFAVLVPILVYWAALELFQDDVHWAKWQLVLFGVIVGTALLSLASVSLGAVRGICVIALFVHLVSVIIRGDRDDLVATRRRFRRWFLMAISILVFVITALEIAGVDGALPAVLYLLHAFVFWVLAAAFVLWATQVDTTIWATRARVPAPGGDPSPAQRALIDRIEAAMAKGAWRQEGLTISQLAQDLNTQDHRLRSAINQGLGHRNFSSFINTFRINAAKEMLSDPAQAERSVLSIAYDVGFASLGPFNRAFRSQMGKTPTEFRAQSLEPR